MFQQSGIWLCSFVSVAPLVPTEPTWTSAALLHPAVEKSLNLPGTGVAAQVANTFVYFCSISAALL